jgi:hypothetical protein
VGGPGARGGRGGSCRGGRWRGGRAGAEAGAVARWRAGAGAVAGPAVARWRARWPVPCARQPALARSAGELGGPTDTERGRRSWAGGVAGAKNGGSDFLARERRRRVKVKRNREETQRERGLRLFPSSAPRSVASS